MVKQCAHEGIVLPDTIFAARKMVPDARTLTRTQHFYAGTALIVSNILTNWKGSRLGSDVFALFPIYYLSIKRRPGVSIALRAADVGITFYHVRTLTLEPISPRTVPFLNLSQLSNLLIKFE